LFLLSISSLKSYNRTITNFSESNRGIEIYSYTFIYIFIQHHLDGGNEKETEKRKVHPGRDPLYPGKVDFEQAVATCLSSPFETEFFDNSGFQPD